MSQYGAQGAAKKGLSATQIVRFYYPHTKAGHRGGNVVRVHITADTDDNTTVVARSGLKVHDLEQPDDDRRPDDGPGGKASRWRMSAGTRRRDQGVLPRPAPGTSGRSSSGDGEFRAAGALRLVLPSSVVTYRGTLQSRSRPAPRRDTG